MRSNKILAYVQILVMICLMVFNGGIVVNPAMKSDAYPCKDHQCGCKSESDCKTHCCCAPNGNQDTFHTNSEKRNGFKTFISSVNCKYGNDPLTPITFTAKYILESRVQTIKESFLCFLCSEVPSNIPDVVIFPPEKPPRYFI
ncbi:MAG: hypothetical protein HYV59_14795 [Planctomycetes bacterium]|nr:hypothetical protein [Planctomycetota bacterium]